jgi:hypothetical protein
MKVIVSSDVKTVGFCYNTVQDGWSIKVNDKVIQEFRSASFSAFANMGYRIIYFDSLKEAVKEAKIKGLIPKTFDVKCLQEQLEVEVTY